MRLNKTQVSFEAAQLLEQKMSEIEYEFRPQPLESIPDEQEGDFGSDFPKFTWKMEAKKLEFPDLTLLLGEQGGVDQMTNMVMKQMSKTLSQAIKEVRVTVYY